MGFLDKAKQLGEQAKVARDKLQAMQNGGSTIPPVTPRPDPGPSGAPSSSAPLWVVPTAAEVASAPEDTAGARKMRDWDGWSPMPEALGWEPTSRTFVLGPGGWEALIIGGPGGTSVQLVTQDVPALYADPQDLRTQLQPGAQDREAPFGGVLLVVGRDLEGYSAAAVVINELAYVVRSVGGDGSEQDLLRVHSVALDSLHHLPE